MDDVLTFESHRGWRPAGREWLLPLVYDELRELAAARMAEEAERPDLPLDATGLVHEAYLRLVGEQRGFEKPGPFLRRRG